MTDELLDRLRELCFAYSEVTERISHGSPSWFVREKKLFVSFDAYQHHGDRVAFWCAPPEGGQDVLVGAEPSRYFVPPYVGHRGWLGVYLDGDVDWDAAALIIDDAYRIVAPRALVARLDLR